MVLAFERERADYAALADDRVHGAVGVADGDTAAEHPAIRTLGGLDPMLDAFLETQEFAGTYRLRLWADPDVPGKARVTIEAVYRPVEDPSRTRRDLERAAPPGSPGQLRAERLLAALKDKLGVTTY